jgi:hypothetical protein
MNAITEEKKSTYSASHRAYYEKNKDKAKSYQQEKKPYMAYYERHREEVRRKQKERYDRRKEERTAPDLSPAPVQV